MSDTDSRKPDARTVARVLVYVVVGLVALFAFYVSYNHIYDLCTRHGQHGLTARAEPLSVDLLIVAAALVVYLQGLEGGDPDNLAKWMPRGLMWAGIVATIAANVLSGWPYGPFGAVIFGWPGLVFAGLVEMVRVAVRRRPAAPGTADSQTVIPAGQPQVPASVYDAAELAYKASVAGGNPLTEYQLHKRFGIPRSQSRKIAPGPVAEPSELPAAAALNGSAADGA
jgi:uncharacterized protein DUF2637